MKRALLREAPYAFTTALTPLSQRHPARISIGTAFLRVLIGSTSQVSLPHSEQTLLKSVRTLVRLQRQRALRFPATLTTAESFGQETKPVRL